MPVVNYYPVPVPFPFESFGGFKLAEVPVLVDGYYPVPVPILFVTFGGFPFV